MVYIEWEHTEPVHISELKYEWKEYGGTNDKLDVNHRRNDDDSPMSFQVKNCLQNIAAETLS